jgi:hypothetical protein
VEQDLAEAAGREDRPSGSTSNPIGSARLGVGVFAAITLIR